MPSGRIVVIEEQQFQLTDDMFRIMKYFQESEAIQPAQQRHLISTFSIRTWRNVLRIVEATHYKPVYPPPLIADSDPRDYIGFPLAEVFQAMEFSELNEVYHAAHYLKIDFVRKCISAFLACRVFCEMSLNSYSEKMKSLGVSEELTAERVEEYQQRFPFIN